MKNLLYITLACLSLTGCKLYSSYERPADVKTEALFRDTTVAYAALEGDTTSLGDTPWQDFFTEPQLQALIQKALEQNIDMREADINIRQAEAGLKVSRLAYYPSIAIGAQGTVSSWDFSRATKTYSIPLSASWEIDAFGKLRNAKKQSEMSLAQVKVYKQATRTAIIAAVANMYYTLQMLDEQLATTQATIKIWEENVKTMLAMKEAGMTNEASVSSARANLISIQASIPALQQQISATENSLCYLLGEAPHAIERAPFTATGFPEKLSVGVPLSLLDARPDVRAAEMQLAYAFYGVNAARAAFYPSITISGQGSWTNSAGSALVNPGKILASAVASLTQPLFAQGKLKANLTIAKADQEKAQLEFQDALLNAGQEVSNALAKYHSASQTVEQRAKQVAELEHTSDVTRTLFVNGNTTTYLEVLTADQTLLNARLSLISDRFDRVQAVITLYQALGGGREIEAAEEH